MAEILIKGMEMPKDNDYLHLIIQNGKVHKAISCGYISTDELNVADAVELPPHGDLIDRSKLVLHGRVDDFGDLQEMNDYYDATEVMNAPTVLEASEVKV